MTQQGFLEPHQNQKLPLGEGFGLGDVTEVRAEPCHGHALRLQEPILERGAADACLGAESKAKIGQKSGRSRVSHGLTRSKSLISSSRFMVEDPEYQRLHNGAAKG